MIKTVCSSSSGGVTTGCCGQAPDEKHILSVLVDWLYANREPRLYDEIACTLRINCGELYVIEGIS